MVKAPASKTMADLKLALLQFDSQVRAYGEMSDKPLEDGLTLVDANIQKESTPLLRVKRTLDGS